jgi:hypothetical protein
MPPQTPTGLRADGPEVPPKSQRIVPIRRRVHAATGRSSNGRAGRVAAQQRAVTRLQRPMEHLGATGHQAARRARPRTADIGVDASAFACKADSPLDAPLLQTSMRATLDAPAEPSICLALRRGNPGTSKLKL